MSPSRASSATLRIAYWCQFFWPEVSAPSRRLLDFGRVWREHGHDVTIVTGMPNHPTGVVSSAYKGKLLAREEKDGLRVLRSWVYASPNQAGARKLFGHLTFALTSLANGLKTWTDRCGDRKLTDVLCRLLGLDYRPDATRGLRPRGARSLARGICGPGRPPARAYHPRSRRARSIYLSPLGPHRRGYRVRSQGELPRRAYRQPRSPRSPTARILSGSRLMCLMRPRRCGISSAWTASSSWPISARTAFRMA